MSDALTRALFNAVANPNAVNSGGLLPFTTTVNVPAVGATVTSVKSYAAILGTTQTYGQLMTAVQSAALGNIWIYALIGTLLYISGGVHQTVMLGQGATGAETNVTGTEGNFGHTQDTAVGHVGDQQWSYGMFPIYLAAGPRLAAGGSSSNNANDVLNVAAAYRTAIGT